jgi:uroporphyrinogen-III synthase
VPANDAYFMKPLISAMASELAKSPPRNVANPGSQA